MESFKSIELEHKKVKKLNDLQVESEEIGHTLSKEVVDYLEGELSEEEYWEKEYELKRKYDEVSEYREKLMDKYNLEYDYEKGSIDGFYEIQRAED